ncbi:MAG TPA: hypothetical protein VFE41_13610 [Acetobacteraceae bacterium]|jgi:hypothetical protein|nr:hypothetical protein [Acetobacteraceae bacterium]
MNSRPASWFSTTVSDTKGTRAIEQRQVTRVQLRPRGHVDALDRHRGRDLPEHPSLPRTKQMRRTTVEADDGDLVRHRLHRLEQRRGQLRPLRLHHGIAVRREFRTHHLQSLDRQLALQVEQPVPARAEHALMPAVAHQQRTLAVLHRHAQHQSLPGHDTSPNVGRTAAPRGEVARRKDGFRARNFLQHRRAEASARARSGARRPRPCRGTMRQT